MHFLQRTARKVSGYGLLTDPDALHGIVEETETVNCCHCQFIMHIRPGSGTKRGFCFMCNAVTCGKPGCMSGCTPFEKRLEEVEAQARFYHLIDELRQESRSRIESLIERG